MENYGAPLPNVSPEELVVMLASRDPASQVVDFPVNQLVLDRLGKPVQRVRMCILKAREKIQCKTEASRLVRAQFKADYKREPTSDDMAAFDLQQQFDDLLACEILVRACRSEHRVNSDDRPAVYACIFESAAWMLDNMTSDEIGILFRLYMDTEITCGAREQVLDDDPLTLKRWADKCQRGEWALAPLASLASADLAELVLGFARLAKNLESSGFPILDPQYLSLLSSSTANQENSQAGSSSSGESQDTSTRIISPEEARAMALSLRDRG